MAYFTNVESRGLLILPVHRLVKNIELPEELIITKLRQYFELEEIKEKHNFLFYLQKAGLRQPTLGLYKKGRFFILRLKNITILDKIIKDKPPPYRRLDISILNYIVFKEILNIDPEDKEKVFFGTDVEQLITKVDTGEGSLLFLLNPVKIEEMIKIASLGHRLPSKSTYFYPKVLSGLVINKH